MEETDPGPVDEIDDWLPLSVLRRQLDTGPLFCKPLARCDEHLLPETVSWPPPPEFQFAAALTDRRSSDARLPWSPRVRVWQQMLLPCPGVEARLLTTKVRGSLTP